MNMKSRMREQHQIGRSADSPIKPMGAVRRFFIRLLLAVVIIGGALAIAQLIVNMLGVSD